MARRLSRQNEPAEILYFPSNPGSRAVFLVEARNRKEMRQVRELFDMVGHLAEVVPVSHGTIMSYAVQVHGDTSLFGKVEWLLKTQFTFSIVERNFSEVTFRLVRSLCEESETPVEELPECGICAATDPFPTRATIHMEGDETPVHVAYCARCTAQHAEESPKRTIRNLLRRDRTRFQVSTEAPVTLMPEIVDEKPQWEADKMAATG